ncbi:MAG: ABC transporter substrate-binding protein [Desulfobacteraceae bacterium]|nr:ABC transporter substrate-binding protein [Desulfobacteraceae bacterium]
MRLKSLLVIFIVLISSSVVFATGFPKLLIATEEYAPYNFKKDGKVQGIAVDMMVELLKKVGSSQSLKDIKLGSWARGYKNVLEKPNAVLFSTTRTKEREGLFKWVCPINTLITEAIALKSRNIKITSNKELLNYKIGTVRDDVGDQLVITAGVPKDKLDRVSSYEVNIKKLNGGRIDLYISSMSNVTVYANKMGIDPDRFESVYVLDESHLCYAFNKGVSDDVINKLQTAYNELIADGTFDKISKKYKK